MRRAKMLWRRNFACFPRHEPITPTRVVLDGRRAATSASCGCLTDNSTGLLSELDHQGKVL